MRNITSRAVVIAVVLGLLVIPGTAIATAQPLDVDPVDYDFSGCDPMEFPDVPSGSTAYQGRYQLTKGSETIGSADVCHVVVSGGFDGGEREETLHGRWHLEGGTVQTVMSGSFVDLDNGLGRGKFVGDIVGGSGDYAASTGTIKGTATFIPQPEDWFRLNIVLNFD